MEDNEHFTNLISNKLAKQIPVAKGTLFDVLVHIVNTDSRIKTKFPQSENLPTIKQINPKQNKPIKQTLQLNTLEQLDIQLDIRDQVRLKNVKFVTRGYYIVAQIPYLRGYYLINANSLRWAFYGSLNTVFATIRLLEKDIIPSGLSDNYRARLYSIANEETLIKRVLGSQFNSSAKSSAE